MNPKKLLHFFLIPLLAFAACVEPYEPEVISTAQNYLVVEGSLYNDSTELRLSRTSGLEGEGTSPEMGAEVWVENEAGSYEQSFEETENGVYRALLSLNENEYYRVRINSRGNEYLSEYVPVTNAPPIEEVSWGVLENQDVQIYVSTRDPEGRTQYYRWEYTETWEYRSAYSSSYMYVDGQLQVRPPEEQFHICYEGSSSSEIYVGSSVKLSEDVISDFPLNQINVEASPRLDHKYSINVKQYALTREAFEFWQTMEKNTENLGTLFDPQPSQLASNLYCSTDPEEEVIGFISAGLASEKRIFIEHNELPFRFHYNRYTTCSYDTTASDSASLYQVFEDESNIPLSQLPFLMPAQYTYSSPTCVDCRRRGGTTDEPDFWE